ncbi:MAG: hypothetical protein V2A73_07320 [Pseudomonadota bacterium]
MITSGNGVGPHGNSLTRNGSYTLTWTQDCYTLEGSWSRSGAAGTATTAVSDYTRCKGLCPSAGTITHTGVKGRTVTVTFDGSDVASWSTSGGLSGTVNLLCTPQ